MKKLSVVILFLITTTLSAQDVFEAARLGDLTRLRELVKLKPDTVNALNNAGFTPLIIAVYRDRIEAVEFLLASGANVDADSPEGSALLGACYKGHLRLAQLLIGRGAALNRPNTHGTTALMYAAMSGNAELVKFLLNRGADKKAAEKSGKTALDYAAVSGSVEIRRLLGD